MTRSRDRSCCSTGLMSCASSIHSSSCSSWNCAAASTLATASCPTPAGAQTRQAQRVSGSVRLLPALDTGAANRGAADAPHATAARLLHRPYLQAASSPRRRTARAIVSSSVARRTGGKEWRTRLSGSQRQLISCTRRGGRRAPDRWGQRPSRAVAGTGISPCRRLDHIQAGGCKVLGDSKIAQTIWFCIEPSSRASAPHPCVARNRPI